MKLVYKTARIHTHKQNYEENNKFRWTINKSTVKMVIS